MSRLKVLTTLAIFVLAYICEAKEHQFDQEVIIMFVSDIITMPAGKDTANVDSISFELGTTVKDTLIKYGADTLIVAFPEWDKADTIIVSSYNPKWKARQLPLD